MGIGTIDEFCLDREWVRQPQLAEEYAKKSAEYRRDLDHAKNKLELTKADLGALIRATPANYSLDKVTEAAIAATIPLQPEYRDALNQLAEAKYNVAVVDGALTAIDHRKKALENLVSLHLADYFSKPKTKGDDEESAKKLIRQKTIRKR